MDRWYEKNREKCLERGKAYNRAHRQEQNETARERRQRKREFASDDRKELIYELSRARCAAGMSQREVGELIGVHTSYISQYECLTEIPSQERLQLWCKVLDVKYRWTEPLKEEYKERRRRD